MLGILIVDAKEDVNHFFVPYNILKNRPITVI